MKTIDYRFNLDLHAEGAQTIKNVQRGDNYVKLIVTFSEEGKPYPLSGIATVKFAAVKADGNYIYDNAQIVNNSVEFILTGQCTAAAGLMVCQFKLIDGGGHIKASPTFALNICENAYDEQPIVESSDEFNALTAYVAQLQAMLANHEFDGESAYELAVDAGYVGTVEQWLASLKGEKGDKGDPGDAIVEVSHFNLATDPKTIYKVSISGGNQYFVFVIRSASAITQWRFTPKDLAQGQTADISIRTGTISTAGFSEIITWEDHWTRLFDFLELVDESTAAEMIATTAYSKAQVNTLINDLNTAKANKSETYTKTQVDNLISAVSTLSFEVVQTLPTTDIKTNVIYLLPKQTPEVGNIYEEWAYINNNWELLGTTDIDISGKVDKTQKIAGIALSGDIQKSSLVSALHDAINPYVNSGDSGYSGQYGINSSYNPVYNAHGSTTWTELAKASDVSGKADAATTLAGYGITDAYTKVDVNGFVSDLNTTKANKSETYNKSQVDNMIPTVPVNVSAFINDAGYLTQHQDISGKADKATTLAGYGITNAYTKNEVDTALSGKADTADVPEMLNDLLDGVTAMRRYLGSSPPPTGNVVAAQLVALPCIWYYDGEAWLIYDKEPGDTAGYYKYKMIQFATSDDIPDISGKADKATTLSGYGITDGMQLARIYQSLDDNTQIKQGQVYINAGEAYIKTDPVGGVGKLELAKKSDISAKENSSNKVEYVQDSSSTTQYPSIKAMTTYVTNGLNNKEATANRVTSINSSSDNSHYPTAKAVKDYVDTAIGNIETALSEV